MPIQSTRLSPPPAPQPIVTGTAVLALSGAVLVGGVSLAVLAVNLPLYLAALLL